MLVAAFPMYDWPEIRAEMDANWRRVAEALVREGIDAPPILTRRNAELPPVAGGIKDDDGRPLAPDPATLPPEELELATLWRHPRLLLAQTCWGPMEGGLAADVQVVSQPDYSAYEGGEGPLYSSAILMRKTEGTPSAPPGISPPRGPRGDHGRTSEPATNGRRGGAGGIISPLDAEKMPGGAHESVPAPADGAALVPLALLRGKGFAHNEPASMSGFLALKRDLEAMGESLSIFPEMIETGSHRASARAVAEGRADVAAVDCRTWNLIRRFEPAARELTVVGWTARRPALPFITSKMTPPEHVAILRRVLGAFPVA